MPKSIIGTRTLRASRYLACFTKGIHQEGLRMGWRAEKEGLLTVWCIRGSFYRDEKWKCTIHHTHSHSTIWRWRWSQNWMKKVRWDHDRLINPQAGVESVVFQYIFLAYPTRHVLVKVWTFIHYSIRVHLAEYVWSGFRCIIECCAPSRYVWYVISGMLSLFGVVILDFYFSLAS